MSLSALSETAMFLPTYSAPVRMIMIGALAAWGAVYAFLVLTAPAPVLSIARFAQIEPHGAPGLPAFELILSNGAPTQAIIDSATLELVAAGASADGALEAPPRYSIVRVDGRAAPGFEDVNPQTATIESGASDARSVTLALGYIVAPTSSERFVIRFESAGLIAPEHRAARVTLLRRGGDTLTREVALPPSQ